MVTNQSSSMIAASRPDAEIADFATRVCPLLTVRYVLRIFLGLFPWYTFSMTPKLSQELVEALKATGTGELEVVDPNDNSVYFVVEGDRHRQAMDALRRQRERDDIAKGIKQDDISSNHSARWITGDNFELAPHSKGATRRISGRFRAAACYSDRILRFLKRAVVASTSADCGRQ